MKKSERTRQQIIACASDLFNVRGYSGTSMSDIMEATGLQKGGIYNHFESKEAIALAAFDHAIKRMARMYAEEVGKAGDNALAQLQAMMRMYVRFAKDSPIPGGCPIMNTAVESDDYDVPGLKERTQIAQRRWQRLIKRIVRDGKAQGLFRENVDGDLLATIVFANVEGGLLLSKLHDDGLYMDCIFDFLNDYIEVNVLV
ncbi:MAG: TetR/AcrR family transcriptional regulator [Chloroflexi bacterium]|nr:TetR/AcrR family transcriptional regulator [Chloroflexota bacterium]